MKTLIASAALLLSFAFAGTALAQPGAHHGHSYDNDGYAVDYDRWDDGDATAYDVPNFEAKVRRGFTFRRIKRLMRKRMQTRIARNAHRIRARFGPGHHARRLIRRMERRERQRFQRRVAVVQARFDAMRRAEVYVHPAPAHTYSTPTYRQPTRVEYQHPTYPDYPRNSDRDRRDRRDRRY